MSRLENTSSNLMNATHQTHLNTVLQGSEETGLHRYIFRWLPKPKRWLYFGWFGGVQIYIREEKL